jgi:hypothetical protein
VLADMARNGKCCHAGLCRLPGRSCRCIAGGLNPLRGKCSVIRAGTESGVPASGTSAGAIGPRIAAGVEHRESDMPGRHRIRKCTSGHQRSCQKSGCSPILCLPGRGRVRRWRSWSASAVIDIVSIGTAPRLVAKLGGFAGDSVMGVLLFLAKTQKNAKNPHGERLRRVGVDSAGRGR